jgi:sugar phosphate isomerase/epimerase
VVEEITASRKLDVATQQQPVSPFRRTVLPVAKLSMNEMTTFKWTLPQDVAHYRRCGFEGIGVWRPKLVEYGEQDSVDLLRGSGLQIASVSFVGGFTGTNGYSFCDAVQEGMDAIRLAAALDADCLVVTSGPRGTHTLNHAKKLLYEALCQLSEEAEEEHVDLAVQPMDPTFARQWSFLNSLDETLSVLDRCNHPNVRMAFDVFHQWPEPELMERIPEIAPVVAAVQLSDWRNPPRSEHDRCLLGKGEIPLAQIVQAFLEAGYDGCFDVKIWSEHLWNSDYAAMLHDCRSRFQSLCVS